MLDANSAVMTAELEKDNSAVTTAELLTVDNETDIFHTMQVANVAEFPIGIVLCQTANHSYAMPNMLYVIIQNLWEWLLIRP